MQNFENAFADENSLDERISILLRNEANWAILKFKSHQWIKDDSKFWGIRNEGRSTAFPEPLQIIQDTISKHLDFDASLTSFWVVLRSNTGDVFAFLPLTFA